LRGPLHGTYAVSQSKGNGSGAALRHRAQGAKPRLTSTSFRLPILAMPADRNRWNPPCARALVLALATVVGGCTTSGVPVTTPSADGGAPEGSLVTACPPAPPAAGSPCSERTLDCEYGDDWSPACNTVAQCWRDGPLDGTWQIQGSAGPATCPTA